MQRKNASFSSNREHAADTRLLSHSLILSLPLTLTRPPNRNGISIPNFITEIAATTHPLRIHDAATCWQPQSIVFQIGQTLDIRDNVNGISIIYVMWMKCDRVCVCVCGWKRRNVFPRFKWPNFPLGQTEKFPLQTEAKAVSFKIFVEFSQKNRPKPASFIIVTTSVFKNVNIENVRSCTAFD